MIVNLTPSGFNLQRTEAGKLRLMPLELRSEWCSPDVGSLNFRGRVFVNAQFVERPVALARLLQREVASCDDACHILNFPVLNH